MTKLLALVFVSGFIIGILESLIRAWWRARRHVPRTVSPKHLVPREDEIITVVVSASGSGGAQGSGGGSYSSTMQSFGSGPSNCCCGHPSAAGYPSGWCGRECVHWALCMRIWEKQLKYSARATWGGEPQPSQTYQALVDYGLAEGDQQKGVVLTGKGRRFDIAEPRCEFVLPGNGLRCRQPVGHSEDDGHWAPFSERTPSRDTLDPPDLLPRSECTCACHHDNGVMHCFPCCDGC